MSKARMGRPPKYHKKYCQMLIKHFDVKPMKVIKKTISYKNGTVIHEGTEVVNDFPTFQLFAHKIGVNGDTLVEWATSVYPEDHPKKGALKYPDFSAAYTHAKELQENFWLINGMRGFLNPQFAIFAGKNIFGDKYKDKQDIDHTSKGEKIAVTVVSYKDAQ